MKRFTLIGAAGFVAPRHMKAIKDTGNSLVAMLDKTDSVGVIDSYFPEARFFTEFERFDRHIDKLRRRNDTDKIDFMSICSPNYLHDAHVRFGLRSDCDVICEKPLVLNPWNIDGLCELEKDTGRNVSTILQLRLHPAITELRTRINAGDATETHDVELTYVTSRGRWYQQSWKGDERKSGGIATNIGVHFYDMLHYVFGARVQSTVHYCDSYKAAGFLEFEKARVQWFLSIDKNDLPKSSREQGQRTFRSITCDGAELEFSGGFADLHARSYEQILAGNGFGLEENRSAIETVAEIRVAQPIGMSGDYHPFLRKAVA